MPPRHLLLAFAVSLVLHAAVLGAGVLRNLLQPPPPQVLQVKLRLPPVEVPPAEALIKNTLDPEEQKPLAKPREPKIEKQPPPAARPIPAKAEKRQIQAAQRKLAEHTFYPPEAIARSLEGDVRVILVLAEDGVITDVQVAASSGHAILDNAAIKAAWAMGRLPGVTARQILLDVYWRLQ